MPHSFSLRVFYEDTDMAGIVYYANYLKFIERARSEWVRELGVDQNAMKDDHGIVFAVRRVEADYLSSARLEDVLTVQSELAVMKGASFVMDQSVLREDRVLFTARVTVATMTLAGRPARIPADIRALMTG